MIAASLRSMTQETALFRVITLNANGIRAAARKGFFDWMRAQDADVICIQETKAQTHQLTDEIDQHVDAVDVDADGCDLRQLR